MDTQIENTVRVKQEPELNIDSDQEISSEAFLNHEERANHNVNIAAVTQQTEGTPNLSTHIKLETSLDLDTSIELNVGEINNQAALPQMPPEAQMCVTTQPERIQIEAAATNAVAHNEIAVETNQRNETDSNSVRVKIEPNLEVNTLPLTNATTNQVSMNPETTADVSTATNSAPEIPTPDVSTATNSAPEIPTPEQANEAIEHAVPQDISPDFFSDLIEDPLDALSMDTLETKYSCMLREPIFLDGITPHAEKRAADNDADNTTAQKRARIPDTEPTTPIPFIRVKAEFRTESDVACLPALSDSATRRRSRDIDVKCYNICNEFEEFGDDKENARQMKPNIAYRRVNYILKLFKKEADADNLLIHIDTVRKLPNNTQYMSQQFYDNRSPLHSANNVQFYFNSPYTNINMEDWGLKSLSPNIARIACIIGCDAYMLNWKQMVTKRPYLSNKSSTAGPQKQCEIKSTFFSNNMTQTDITGPVCKKPQKARTATIPTQTDPIPVAMPAFLKCVQNFPYLKQMNLLNPNQLLALNDFAELMQQQDIAADVYRLRECLLRVFQRSQMPAHNSPIYAPAPAMANHIMIQPMQSSSPPPPPIISNFERQHLQQQPHYSRSHPHQQHNVPQAVQRPSQMWFQQDVPQSSNSNRHYMQNIPNTSNRRYQH